MRFHVGFSFGWKEIKKLIIPILIVIALYFGFNMNVYAADTVVPFTSSGQQFYRSVCIEDDIQTTCTQFGAQGYQPIPFDSYYFLSPADPVYNAVYRFNQINIDSSGYTVKPNIFYKLVVRFDTGDMLDVDLDSWKNLRCGVYVNDSWNTKVSDVCFGSYNNYTYTAYVRSTVVGSGIALFIGNTTDMSKSLLYYNVQDAYQQGARASSLSIYTVDDNSGLLEGIDNSINNQTGVIEDGFDQTNDNLQDIEDTITDDDVDLGSGDSFFNDFTVEDNGGISAIVKAPLRMFQSLVNGNNQCQALSFPIMGTEVTLPSGCILWDNVPDNVVTLWHVIILGLASYRILIDLFRIIENLKEPDNDKVEVTDL